MSAAVILVTAALLLVPYLVSASLHPAQDTGELQQIVQTLSASSDRSTGTPGCKLAADYIKREFQSLSFGRVGGLSISVPVRLAETCFLTSADGRQLPIQPLLLNAVDPETIPSADQTAPLLYVGAGTTTDFNHQTVKGAVIVMDLDSGKNWQQAAALGAKALIFLDHGMTRAETDFPTPNFFFKEKQELTPIRFPRFWVDQNEFTAWLGREPQTLRNEPAQKVSLTAPVAWKAGPAENVHLLIPGRDPRLKKELLIIEAFYDSTAMVAGRAPGADEALGAATLIRLARFLKEHPPARSVMLTATSGHSQTLAGLREMIWSLRVRSQYLNRLKKKLQTDKKAVDVYLDTIKALSRPENDWNLPHAAMKAALNNQIKTEIDAISRALIRLRLESPGSTPAGQIQNLVQRRRLLQRLDWQDDLSRLSAEDREQLKALLPAAELYYRRMGEDIRKQLDLLKSILNFRKMMKGKEPAAIVSLHLSSHGNGVGAFGQGWLYPLKPSINRAGCYSALDAALKHCAAETEHAGSRRPLLFDTLRPNRMRDWRSELPDRPALGGEVSSLAGYLGVTLATVNDARFAWGTPHDTSAHVNWEYAAHQADFVCHLIRSLAAAPVIQTNTLPADGFSTVTGRAKILRHGELFADQPAAGTMVMAFQGPQRYYAMTDTRGEFLLKGLCDKKHALDKVIIEAYGFDPENGEIHWAIDKRRTGKPAYRLKMQRQYMQTDLILFNCRQSSLFDLLEPRNFNYLTKLELLDGSRDAPFLTYSHSRIDTRASSLAAVFLEPRARMKIMLSDSLLAKKLILTNGTADLPEGSGYLLEDHPALTATPFKAAGDMWTFITPRIRNLEKHGIYDESIRALQQEGLEALAQASAYLEAGLYDRFNGTAAKAFALASRVYDQVDRTQKDVLLGVLFYIALFVPFAVCLERLLFAWADIHKRILSFCLILALLITVIYHVHPAFQLAYSPLVVVLAFFIMGLSLLVALIIILRFEAEMKRLQTHAGAMNISEISRGKAFLAAFFLGLGNLRRRPLRTALTCITLILLTFTIMSFTTVKTARHHVRIRLQNQAAYQGLLFKKVNWQSLPPEAAAVLMDTFGKEGRIAPRAWITADDPTRAGRLPVQYQEHSFEAAGIIGLGPAEQQVSGLGRMLVGGRWFQEDERRAVILPDRMAANLGIDPKAPANAVVKIWGQPFEVVGVFSGEALAEFRDLDGEPPTPVIFPEEVVAEMSEVEMEALESGEDVQDFQSRYDHLAAELTIILPLNTVLAAGGALKSIAVGMTPATDISAAARQMTDRFGLSLFSGEGRDCFLNQSSDSLSYSGMPNIIIPLIISILIVLNTMISSVYERKREIGIYTSIGLAPTHVAFLFMAETLAFAVISVIIGYVLAQISATIFAGTALWAGITVNYSSLAGVAAMLLVVAVVLVSAIYPARVAAAIAIPDVNRSWTMPASVENVIELSLPFMLQHRELAGVCGYLQAYFKAHQDVSHGLFSTGATSTHFTCPSPCIDLSSPPVCRQPQDAGPACIQLQQKVWLAPFDFGIMQQVDLTFRPACTGENLLEIHVRLERRSGETNVWWRLNKAFLNRLRKQLLIWRSLDSTTREEYGKALKER